MKIAEVFGVPKQFRKTLEGAEVIEKGKRVNATKYIKPESTAEKARALVRGQYGPLEVQEHFSSLEKKKKIHQEIAKELSKINNSSAKSYLRRTKISFDPAKSTSDDKTTGFKYRYNSLISGLSPASRKAVRRAEDKARKAGIKLSKQSILNYIQTYLKE